MAVKFEFKVSSTKPRTKAKETNPEETKTEETKTEEKSEKKPRTFYKIVRDRIKRMKLRNKIILITVGTAIAVNSASKAKNNEADTILSPTQKEVLKDNPITVDASHLVNGYASSSSERKVINQIYTGKYVEVTGHIKEIVENHVFLENDAPEKWYGDMIEVDCNFQGSQTMVEVTELSEEQMVTILGYCRGLDNLSVQLDDCVIINEGSKTIQ